MDYTRVTFEKQPYLYVDRTCSYDPGEIAEAMGSGFGELMGVIGAKGIQPLSMPMSVYHEMDPNQLTFQAAMLVSASDAAKAEGNVKAGALPAGEVAHVLHTGPYSGLGATHSALWAALEKDGVAATNPVWEIYVDDPGETTEEALRTEIYIKLD